jgi:hypothetical protein
MKHTGRGGGGMKLNLPPMASVGGIGSGVQFHKHSDGWHVLVHGSKRWFLSEQKKLPLPSFPPSRLATKHYAEQILPRLPEADRPIECVQEPGSLIYVPEGWYHATLNLDPFTVGIAGQNFSRGAVTPAMKLYMDFNSRGGDAELARLDRLKELAAPAVDEGLAYDKATVLWNMDRRNDAIAAARESMLSNPRHADSCKLFAMYSIITAMEHPGAYTGDMEEVCHCPTGVEF